MKKLGLLVFVVHSLNAQTSPCDVNHDGVVNIADVQTEINEALGVTTCTTDLSGDAKCDVVDVQLVITSALGGACNAAQPSVQSNIQLPVEVIGLDGTTKAVSFNVPTGANLSGTMKLSMQIHGLKYETQASVQVNNSAWLPINSSSVTILGLGASYGGIGGGFKTLQMTMNLPAATVIAGANKLTFKFNGTDGKVSGFRVLALNVLDASGNALVPQTTFTWEDPNTWQPPSTQASDIAAGKSLWYTAALTVPTSSGAASIQAHCTSCHAQDGRDLKYFNYSNNSVQVRSMFHGLTSQQGLQIASYIRSLSVPNPGRPWNPPYQPGPGLDSLPVANWSAGVGLNGVLQHDVDMWPWLAPSNNTTGWAPTGNLNAREMPIAFQLPDWNSWLPTVHPLDAFGSTFTNSTLVTLYNQVRNGLVPGNAQAYKAISGTLWLWKSYDFAFLGPLTKAGTDAAWNNPAYTDSIYSARLWSMTKLWEINQEFGLEGMAQTAFGPRSDVRAWFSEEPFFASPNMIHIPPTAAGMGNGKLITATYTRFEWYQLQMILNPHGSAGIFTATTPMDFPYTYDHIQGLGYQSSPTAPQGGLTLLWLIKGLQLSNENGVGPQAGSSGWEPFVNDPSRMYRYATQFIWNDFTPAEQVTAMTAYLQYWLGKATSFTPQQYYQGGWTTATTAIDNLAPASGFGDSIAFLIPEVLYAGVNPALGSQMANWAKTVWPSYNWAALLTTHCIPSNPAPYCKP